jgi:hypothetical protein
MKRITKIALGIAAPMVASPFILTKVVEHLLMDRERFAKEVGYPLPDRSRIIETQAEIWSLADGDNYTWEIESTEPLLPWIQEVGTLEYDQTYRASVTLSDGRQETSYISLGPSGKQARVETFRP